MTPSRRLLVHIAGASFAALYFIFLLTPIAIMVPASFTAQDILMFPPDRFSLRWYKEVLESTDWLAAATVSLHVSTIAMIIATLAGFLVGFCVFHYGPLGNGLRLLLISPMLVPHIVIATGLFEILVPLRLLGSKWVLAIAQAAMALPITVILSITAFEAIDRNLWTAASTLGARPFQITRKVLLPIIAAASATSLILSFESAWHEVTLAVFVGPAVEPTLANRMFSLLLQESSPALAAVSSLLLLVTLCAAVVAWATRRRLAAPAPQSEP